MNALEALVIARDAYLNDTFTLKDNILSFPGTDNFKDWLSDLEAYEICEHKEYPGKVHDGFAKRLDYLWNQIKLPPVGDIYVIGHSLGGALATLASVRLKSLGYNPIVYTFGSPRVGNKTFSEQYHITNYERWVNRFDVVPHVPSYELIESYTHVGDLKYINKDGKLTEKQAALDLIGLIKHNYLTIEDHLTKNYINSISSLDQFKLSISARKDVQQ